MSGSSITAEPPARGAPPPDHEPGRWRRYAVGAAFLTPAAVFLGIWILYPTIYTIIRSFFGRSGWDNFVGVDNYRTLFTTDTLLTAIKNNAIWVVVVPALVTAIGLVFAVLLEKVRWSLAFKTAVFMPMAVSLFAAGIIWRVMYEQDPSQGAVNAAGAAVINAIDPPGVLPDATPSTDRLSGSKGTGLVLQQPLQAGDTANLGLTGITESDLPSDAVQAATPEPLQGGITGVVWRDFKPGGGTPGQVEQGEIGIPGVTVELRNGSGKTVDTTTTDPNGTFAFEDVGSGSYQAAIGAATFDEPWGGVSWLGSKLITPAIIIAYIWVWAGFSMVVIGAGLAALPREVLEAARTDGGSEWQVFRRVTAPLLAPVLSVVFITMIINVLKVFDIVLSVAPGSVQDDANVIALAMWRTSFGGVNNFGIGSAVATFLFILVIPALLLNIRRFRREV